MSFRALNHFGLWGERLGQEKQETRGMPLRGEATRRLVEALPTSASDSESEISMTEEANLSRYGVAHHQK